MVIGFSMLSALLILAYASSRAVALCAAIGSLLLFVLSLFIKKLKKGLLIPAVLLSVSLVSILFLSSEKAYTETSSLGGENCLVEATVLENPYVREDKARCYCLLKLKTINGEKVRGRLRLSFSETYDEILRSDLKIGNKLSFNANVYSVGENNDEVQNRFKAQKVFLGAYMAKNLKVQEPRFRSFSYYTSALRLKASEIFLKHFSSETAGLLIGILTGETHYLSDEFYSLSQKAGVAHIMAVSGMNLSVWIFFLGALFEDKKKKSKLPYILMFLAVIFMMSFTSMTGSVKRAGFMSLLYIVGKLFSKSSDPLNSLGFSLVVILSFNPYAVFDAGFMLSVFATLGILIMAIPISEKLKFRFCFGGESNFFIKGLSLILESLLISLSVSVFTLPLIYYYFGFVSIVSPLTNLLILPFTTPLMVLVGLFAFFSSVPVLSLVIGLVCKYIAIYVIKEVSLFGGLSFAAFTLDYVFMPFFLVFAAVLLILFFAFKNLKIKTAFAAIIACSFALCLFVESYMNIGSYRITDISKDKGNCYIVSSENRGVIVGFSGDYYLEDAVLNEVRKRNLKIDFIIPDYLAEKNTLDRVNEIFGSCVIENDAEITLFGNVEIIRKGNSVYASGNGKNFKLFGLQESEKYDILKNDNEIIRKAR